MSIYKQIFLEAWTVLKNHKALWAFGFFAILFSGSVEGDLYYNFLSNQNNTVYNLVNNILSKDALVNLQHNWSSGLSSAGFLFFTFLCLILALLLILFLSVASQMLVIARTNDILKNPKAPSLKFSELFFGAFAGVKASLLKATLINIIFKFFVFLVFLLISVPIIVSSGIPNVTADFSYLLLFVLLMPITIIASLYTKYVVTSLVINKYSLKLALTDAYKILTKNWLLSVELSFILFLFNIIAVFATLLIISGLAIPLWFLAVAVGQMASYQAYVVMVALSYLILFLVFLLCNALLSTFSIAVWTSLYLKLSKTNTSITSFVSNLSQKYTANKL